MKAASGNSDLNIHLRARPQDRELIDRAAELTGTNRSQFMLGSALRAAKNILLDQTNIHADAAAFQKILAWLDGEATPEELRGMERLKAAMPKAGGRPG